MDRASGPYAEPRSAERRSGRKQWPDRCDGGAWYDPARCQFLSHGNPAHAGLPGHPSTAQISYPGRCERGTPIGPAFETSLTTCSPWESRHQNGRRGSAPRFCQSLPTARAQRSAAIWSAVCGRPEASCLCSTRLGARFRGGRSRPALRTDGPNSGVQTLSNRTGWCAG
jgi:hypothetical protein